MSSSRKWAVAFIPPDLYDCVREYIMDKGDTDRIYSPRIVVIRAVEEFLIRKGYDVQIEEIRTAFQSKKAVRIFSMDKLTSVQRDAVVLIMKWRKLKEQEAIKYVVEHPNEIQQAVEEIDVDHRT